MIGPDFRTILLDQRGAAIILWSFFAISIPIYLVIARQLLGNPSLGTNPAIAEPSRIIFWILTVVDIGYYVYWRKKYLTPQAIRRDARQTKLFRAVADFNGVDQIVEGFLPGELNREQKQTQKRQDDLVGDVAAEKR